MLDRLNYKSLWLIFLLPGILFPLRIAFAVGGIATDGTVGPAQTLSGANVTIPQNLGKTVGKNLFHSFNQFNINNGQTVTFTETAPHALDNVISRVTGGSPSAIDGTLRSTPGGHANLYLVNPSGVMFGQNAKIDVPSAFHASTADEVRFQDGAKFSASQPAGSTLTAAAPTSFGFLSTSSATNGLLKVDGAQLAVKTGQKLDMVGRNINVDHRATLSAPSGEVRLEATGLGSVNIPLDQSSEAAHGTLALTKSTIDASGEGGGKIIIRGSDLKMDQGAKILADTNGKKDGSKIDVRLTGDMDMKSGGIISASTFGSGSAGNIIITAKNLSIDGQTTNLNGQKTYVPTRISSTAGSGDTPGERTGNSGNITVDIADRLSLIGGGQINASSFSTGDAGRITVNAGQLLIDGQDALLFRDSSGVPVQTGIFTAAGRTWSGKGNDLTVTVQGDINMKSGGKISVSTNGLQAAGNIVVAGQGNINIRDGSEILASTFGNGDAGNLHVKAKNLSIDGQTILNGKKSYLPTRIASTAGSGDTPGERTGNSGNITVDIADRLSLIGGGQINASSFSTGDAGRITVNAGQLLIDGQDALLFRDSSGVPVQTGIFTAAGRTWSGKGNDLTVTVQGDINMKSGGKISAITRGSQAAGSIVVTSQDDINIKDGSEIITSTFGSGDAGNLHVKAKNLSIDGLDAGIFNGATDASSGKGGDITVAVQENINMKSGGQISASTRGSGDAGSIRVKAKNLSIDGHAPFNRHTLTLIASTAGSDLIYDKTTGNAGNIEVDIADHLSLTGGGQIGASSFNKGNAGTITVNAGQLLIDGQDVPVDNLGNPLETGIFTAAGRAWSGKGGNITVAIQGDMNMKAGGEISAITRGIGAAGNIYIKAKNLKLDNKSEINASTENIKKAGDVVVETGRLSLDNGSRIFAEALTGSTGETGNVRITASDSIVLSNQSKISIENAGTTIVSQQTKTGSLSISPPNLFISAPNIFLDNSQITTNSKYNIDANAIQVNFTDQLFLDQESYISTEANNGNGGHIDIRGGRLIQLIDSGLKTNVHGQQNGNGGDINVTAENLVMETGLIQANTVAPLASGGGIRLNLSALIPSGESLVQGGDQPVPWKPYEFGLNVIQAAAPNGISGLIQSTAPQLDLSGVLSNLGGPQFDTSTISQDYCSLGTGSSLIRQGKGGLLPRSRDSVMY